MKKVFSLTKKSEIYLYGDNFIAVELLNKLKRSGYTVKGILDRKFSLSDEIDKSRKLYGNDVDLLTIESAAELIGFDSALVIVCLNNGLAHDGVANTVFKLCKTQKILYLPMSTDLPVYIEHALRVNYSAVRGYEFSLVKNVPLYEEYDNAFKIIDHTKRYVSFWCPIDMLYSEISSFYDTFFVKMRRGNREAFRKYEDKPITEIRPYWEIWGYFEGKNEIYPTEYLIMNGDNWNKFGNDSGREALLKDREKLFLIYQKYFLYDMHFFEDSPAACEIVQGKIRVTDGWHRTLYLYYKGLDRVPIKLTAKDYKQLVKGLK